MGSDRKIPLLVAAALAFALVAPWPRPASDAAARPPAAAEGSREPAADRRARSERGATDAGKGRLRPSRPPAFPAARPGATRPAVPRAGAALPEDAAAPPPLSAAVDDAVRDASRDGREPAVFGQLRRSKYLPVPPEVRALAEEVAKDRTNAADRARAIYRWITQNIVYDAVEWSRATQGEDGYAHDHDPASVLARGTTVCVGYAWLFDAMCAAVGVDATWLVGDVRGYRGTPDDALVTAFRHAWNAVRLDDGSWHLLDATWGAVQDGEKAEDAASRTDYYFDTPAAQFVFDHLPEKAEWQLLETPVDAASFTALPNLKPSFFTNGLKLGRDYGSVLKARRGDGAALVFTAPGGVDVAATFGAASGEGEFERLDIFDAPGGVKAIPLPRLSDGEHLVRLYSGPGGAPLECSADFVIKVE